MRLHLNELREKAQLPTDVSDRIANAEMVRLCEAKIRDHPDNAMMALAHTLARDVFLSSEDIGAISELPFSRRTVPAGSYLVREGEAPTQSALLISGFAFRQKLTRNGARQILSVHISGEALDLQSLFLDISDYNVQTLSQSDIVFIPKPAMAELARTRPTIAHAITTSLLIDGSISREWLLNIGRRDARTRLAHLLCEFEMRFTRQANTEDHNCQMPMTQEQLGDALGLTAVHINRLLGRLQSNGLLTRTRRSISLLDVKRLQDVADFSPNYLHLQQKRS